MAYDSICVSGEAFWKSPSDIDVANYVTEAGAQDAATMAFTFGNATGAADQVVAPGIPATIPAVVAYTGDSTSKP